MGQAVEYIRRKRSRECYYGESQKGLAESGKIATCECTDDDYGCDFGYEREPHGKRRCVWAGAVGDSAEHDKYMEKVNLGWWCNRLLMSCV